MNPFEHVYNIIYKEYGCQGWWPLSCGNNPTRTDDMRGYHPGNYELPDTDSQIYEICIGAILTQNVGWVNVEKALVNLKKLNVINPAKLLKTDEALLKNAIRPAGYYNQKAKKLIGFTKFYLTLKTRTPSREELLDIWGIGDETADSILLYAFKKTEFVVDAYTKRIFIHLGLIDEKAKYGEIKALLENNIKPDLVIYQEYHALIVEHAKKYYSKKPYGVGCPLKKYL